MIVLEYLYYKYMPQTASVAIRKSCRGNKLIYKLFFICGNTDFLYAKK